MNNPPPAPAEAQAAALPARKPSSSVLRWITALLWAALLALAAWLGWRNREVLWSYLLQADYWHLLRAVPFYLGTLVASVIGWASIMSEFAPPIRLADHVRIYLATLAARRLPGTVWYVGGRLVWYRELGLSGAVVSLASAIELIVTLVTGAMVGLLVLPLGMPLPGYVTALLVMGALGGGCLLHPVVLGALTRCLGHPLVRPVGLWSVAKWIGAYLAAWVMGGLMLWELISAFWPLGGHQIALTIGIWGLSGASGLVTLFLPSSLGMTELTLTMLISRHMPLALAVAIAVLTRLFTTLAEVLVALAFFPLLRQLRPPPAS